MGPLLKFLDILAKKNDWEDWSDLVFNAQPRTIQNCIENADTFFKKAASNELKQFIEYEKENED